MPVSGHQCPPMSSLSDRSCMHHRPVENIWVGNTRVLTLVGSPLKANTMQSLMLPALPMFLMFLMLLIYVCIACLCVPHLHWWTLWTWIFFFLHRKYTVFSWSMFLTLAIEHGPTDSTTPWVRRTMIGHGPYGDHQHHISIELCNHRLTVCSTCSVSCTSRWLRQLQPVFLCIWCPSFHP